MPQLKQTMARAATSRDSLDCAAATRLPVLSKLRRDSVGADFLASFPDLLAKAYLAKPLAQ